MIHKRLNYFLTLPAYGQLDCVSLYFLLMNSPVRQTTRPVISASLLRSAFSVTLPVLFGYFAIGIPFGLILVKAGYPWWLSPIMSILMYAGAGQYVAVSLFAARLPLPTMIVTMLMVNIRHIVYGISLTEKFKTVGRWKPYLIFSLTDETYALLTGVTVPKNMNPGAFYGSIAVMNHLYWIIGSLVGAIAGEMIPFSFVGVDFALTALFAVLLIDQLRRSKDYVPAIIGGCCAAGALILIGPGNMLIAALTGSIAVLMLIRGGRQ